jgi:hypothetical protein
MEDSDVIVLDDDDVVVVPGPSTAKDFIPLPSAEPRARKRSVKSPARARGRTRASSVSATRGRGRGSTGSLGQASPRLSGGITPANRRGRGRRGTCTPSRGSRGGIGRGTKRRLEKDKKKSEDDSVQYIDEDDVSSSDDDVVIEGRKKRKVSKVKTTKTILQAVNVELGSNLPGSNLFNTTNIHLSGPDASALIASKLSLPAPVVARVVNLLQQDNTVPFLARYRREQVGHLDPEKLRQIELTLNRVTVLRNRQQNALVTLAARNALTPEVKQAVERSTSLAELASVLEPFTQKKTSKAEEARKAGLEPFARAVLEEGKMVQTVVDEFCVKNKVDPSVARTGIVGKFLNTDSLHLRS